MAIYSTVQDVLSYSGVNPDALGFDDQDELEAFVQATLEQVKDFIDRDRNQDFHALAAVPPLVTNVAMRMAAHSLRMAERQRNKSVVRIDDDGDGTLEAGEVGLAYGAAIKDLRRIPCRPRFSMSTTAAVDDET